ncbi:MAG: hypothetical protein CM15mP120_15400 [Pseudomonadota bacterium]|nr:MAG: hypothetical protein CM15mP120_15400 [Pseudomonadota bacterium]
MPLTRFLWGGRTAAHEHLHEAGVEILMTIQRCGFDLRAGRGRARRITVTRKRQQQKNVGAAGPKNSPGSELLPRHGNGWHNNPAAHRGFAQKAAPQRPEQQNLDNIAQQKFSLLPNHGRDLQKRRRPAGFVWAPGRKANKHQGAPKMQNPYCAGCGAFSLMGRRIPVRVQGFHKRGLGKILPSIATA